MKRYINQIVPFLMMGVAIVAFILGIMVLAYLFLFGAVIGFILFMVHWLKERFFIHKKNISRADNREGRIIDTDDWKELK